MRDVLALCDEAGVAVKLAPAASELVTAADRPITLRSVEIEDLLRREPVVTDIAAVRQSLQGQRVLITGGGGSIGSELCRQVLRCEPEAIALLGHGENSVFDITNELEALKRSLKSASASGGDLSRVQIKALIADVRSKQRMTNVMHSFHPDVIFHAAAHKHVPLMELNPAEAISNNVFGTKIVSEVAAELGVRRLVMISSDKAVNPTSIMGASKRAAELLVLQAARETGYSYVAVRFGNVLGSRGSVVPLFRKQIAAGGPVTVSHPDMRRYFMTIPEAVQLVLQASVLGSGGEVFMLDMGDPVRIVDLARDLIELSGLEPEKDIPIVFTGIRPGEKLFEELFVKGEVYEQTHHEKILLARNASTFVPEKLDDWLAEFADAVSGDDGPRIRSILRSLVPEFQPETLRADQRPEQRLTEGVQSAVLRTH
jgi:FlaA1/EpsC-like NDP-sugar epimerase